LIHRSSGRRYKIIFHLGDYFGRRGVDLPKLTFLDDNSSAFGNRPAGRRYHVPGDDPLSYSIRKSHRHIAILITGDSQSSLNFDFAILRFRVLAPQPTKIDFTLVSIGTRNSREYAAFPARRILYVSRMRE
jgi:hypothetical protein